MPFGEGAPNCPNWMPEFEEKQYDLLPAKTRYCVSKRWPQTKRPPTFVSRRAVSPPHRYQMYAFYRLEMELRPGTVIIG